jgi:drug/metabolite transporter (DMT)-like permease
MTHSSQSIPILCYLFAGLLGAFGQYFYKIGSDRLKSDPILSNWPIFLGAFFFVLVMVCFVAGFRFGGRLSVVYPVYATTFIWATLIAIFIEKETVSASLWAGIFLICSGVILIARSSSS